RRGRDPARLHGRTAALRGCGPADALPRRLVAAVAAELPDRRRDARPPDAGPLALPPAALAAQALPPRRAARGAGPNGHDARRLPAPAPRDAGRARRLRSRLPHVLRGHRPELQGRKGRVGAVVRAGRGRAARVRGRDRPALPDEAHALACARDGAIPAQASRASAGAAVSDTSAKYAGAAERWTEEAYADSVAYLRHRAELIVSLGPPLEPDDRILYLACGDAGLADFLRGYDYRGADASEEMVRAARRRGARVELA